MIFTIQHVYPITQAKWPDHSRYLSNSNSNSTLILFLTLILILNPNTNSVPFSYPISYPNHYLIHYLIHFSIHYAFPYPIHYHIHYAFPCPIPYPNPFSYPSGYTLCFKTIYAGIIWKLCCLIKQFTHYKFVNRAKFYKTKISNSELENTKF